MFYLVLVALAYHGEMPVLIPHLYPSEAACHAAAKNWDRPDSFADPMRTHVCILTAAK